MTSTNLTRKNEAQKGLTVKTASWISTAMMLIAVIYLSIAPSLDAQNAIGGPAAGSFTTSSVHYLA